MNGLMKFALLVLLGAAAATAHRDLLQGDGRPSQCDTNTGKWDPHEINCDFNCPSGGWEINADCDDDACTTVRVKVDQDGAPDEQEVEFNCTVASPGTVPDCGDVAAKFTDTCVQSTVPVVLGAWKASPNPDKMG